ncbi:MAG: isochorismatase (2,3 dihydro-2,3 dihydroxybenzoate synthase)-like protein [Rhizobacter sp.]|nr:isochorismatase (2,3 dihydro-2,3 dihydroxybenzoate synthase)-like protein [Rhizobacter sp.]
MDASPSAPHRFSFGAEARPLDESRRVLLLVDFINPLQFPQADAIADAAVEAARKTSILKRRLAERGVRSIYANDNYGIWQSEFRDVLGFCKASGGAAQQLAILLDPSADDFTVLKPRHSAFFATPLELLLQQMKTREIVLVGLAADICVQLTAMDAFLRGFEVTVPRDCTAAESAERKEAAIAHMTTALRVKVVDSAEIDL